MGLRVLGGWEKEIEWVRSLSGFSVDSAIDLAKIVCYAE